MKKKIFQSFIGCTILLVGFGFIFLSGCSRKNIPKTKTSFAFDTVISVTYYDEKDGAAVQDAIDSCSRYEKIFSITNPKSELYRLNAAAGTTVSVSKDLYHVIKTALTYCSLSEGKFDITFGKISQLYGFSEAEHHVPTEAELSALLPHTGYEKILLDEASHSVTITDPETIIDLGAIAKGYVADKMKAQLKDAGVTSAIINLGGNVLLIGAQPNGSDFEVGIQSPEVHSSTPYTTLSLKDKAIVTSGTYQRCFTEDGVTYHHLLDTATGLPLNNGLVSVTIVADDAATADALSTTVFALGKEKGQKLLNDMGLKGILITTQEAAKANK